MVGLTISAVKSEVMVFSRKHHEPNVTLWIDGRSLPQTKEFKYLGVFFDSGATLEYTSTVRAKTMLSKIEFHEIDSWNLLGAHPRLLYKGLVGSILDYASVCYSRMATMHFFISFHFIY
jgi:hypothetical protein